jgi:hypothetical protein
MVGRIQFGGFTSVSWDSNNAYKTDNSQQTFIFSVKDPQSFVHFRMDQHSEMAMILMSPIAAMRIQKVIHTSELDIKMTPD